MSRGGGDMCSAIHTFCASSVRVRVHLFPIAAAAAGGGVGFWSEPPPGGAGGEGANEVECRLVFHVSADTTAAWRHRDCRPKQRLAALHCAHARAILGNTHLSGEGVARGGRLRGS